MSQRAQIHREKQPTKDVNENEGASEDGTLELGQQGWQVVKST